MNHRWLKLRVHLRRLRWPLSLMACWFIGGLLIFRYFEGLEWPDAWLSALYFEIQGDPFSQGYAYWGQPIVFGILIGAVLRESMQNYVERCRAMSGLLKNHTVIVGYSSLGKRLVNHHIKHKLPYVVIEKNKDLVDEIMRLGEPVVVDDARAEHTLPAAHISKARRLIVASNNIESALIVTKKARDANPDLKIAVRCDRDEFVAILTQLGADHVYSTSLITFHEITKHLEGAA